MLKCREVAERANDYVDRDLPWYQSLAMSLHLSMCKHCSGFVRKLRLVITLVKEQPRETLSDEHAEEVVNTVLQMEKKSPHEQD